jgi:putative transposase
MEEAKERIEAWRTDYNESRPHQALQEATPAEFALRTLELEKSKSKKTVGN